MSKLLTDPVVDSAKAALREQAHQQRKALGSAVRAEHARAAAAHFFDKIDIPEGAIVAAYWPIRDEIDCKPVLIQLMDSFQPVCLPVVTGDGMPLRFRAWEQGAQLFEAGFGTMAPADSAPEAIPDILIIPLLGFDRHGTRLGYGQGYYDRTLAVLEKKPVTVGYAFGAQELDLIPRDTHDVPLDYLVTEAGVRRFDN